MKAVSLFLAAFLLASCSNGTGGIRPGRGGKGGRSRKKPEEISYASPTYAHALTETIKAHIKSCSSPKPDPKVCEAPDFWQFPMRSVKLALVAAKVTPSYLPGGTSAVFGNELFRSGFKEVKARREDQIPPGAIVAYETSIPFAEVKGDDGSYYGNQARLGSAFDKKITLLLATGAEGETMSALPATTLEISAVTVWVKLPDTEAR